jgi:hypothetical protein
MSEIKSISNVEQINSNNVYPQKTTRISNNFLSYLGEPQKLDDIFQKASQKYNVSVDLLKAIGKAESSFDEKAVSKSGAQGIMQLMPKTAAYLGVTDSFDPEQNIMGGAKYISELLNKYDGNTSLALAAYNAGSNNVAKYGGIPPFKETQNYVIKVTQFMKGGVDTGNKTVVTRSNLHNSVYITKKPVTSESLTDEVTEFDNIFSYDDYLKFLDMFFNENEQDNKKDSDSALSINSNMNIPLVLKLRNI